MRHYGVYHPKAGWWPSRSIIFHTTSWAVAEAQRDYCRNSLRGMEDYIDGSLYVVVPLEDWCDGHFKLPEGQASEA